jgi:hypothetical protein
MSDFKNKIGHDNFVWWIGVVEDRVDPLFLGRCKVRIFGSHTDNLQEIPTSELPWATPVYPVNDSRSFSAPLEGDYVFGFFLDGSSSQAPAMLGVFPAIPQKEPNEIQGVGFNARAKYTNSVIKESDAVLPVVYTDTPAMKPIRVGTSTAPAPANTKKGTGIEKSDNSRKHVCDIANNIRFQQAIEALKSSQLFQAIRTAIEAVTSAAGASPLVTQIIGAIKVIRNILSEIRKFLDFINEVILEITNYIAYVAKLIAYILAAPARLLQLLKDCLSNLLSSISASLGLTGVSDISGGLISEVSGLIKDVSATVSLAGSTVAGAQTLVSTAETALNPKSYSGRI